MTDTNETVVKKGEIDHVLRFRQKYRIEGDVEYLEPWPSTELLDETTMQINADAGTTPLTLAFRSSCIDFRRVDINSTARPMMIATAGNIRNGRFKFSSGDDEIIATRDKMLLPCGQTSRNELLEDRAPAGQAYQILQSRYGEEIGKVDGSDNDLDVQDPYFMDSEIELGHGNNRISSDEKRAASLIRSKLTDGSGNSKLFFGTVIDSRLQLGSGNKALAGLLLSSSEIVVGGNLQMEARDTENLNLSVRGNLTAEIGSLAGTATTDPKRTNYFKVGGNAKLNVAITKNTNFQFMGAQGSDINLGIGSNNNVTFGAGNDKVTIGFEELARHENTGIGTGGWIKGRSSGNFIFMSGYVKGNIYPIMLDAQPANIYSAGAGNDEVHFSHTSVDDLLGRRIEFREENGETVMSIYDKNRSILLETLKGFDKVTFDRSANGSAAASYTMENFKAFYAAQQQKDVAKPAPAR